MLDSAAPRHDVMPQCQSVLYRDPAYVMGVAKPVFGVRDLPAAIAANRHVHARSMCQVLVTCVGGLAWINVSRGHLRPDPQASARA